MNLNKVTIGVIDDGINKNLCEFDYIKYDIEITSSLKIITKENS